MLNVIILNFITLNFIMVKFLELSIVMLNVVMLRVVPHNVVLLFKCKIMPKDPQWTNLANRTRPGSSLQL